MQEVIEKYKQIIKTDDVFNLWEQELSLRNQARVRHSGNSAVRVDTAEELDFLLRSLYFGKKRNDFLEILFYSLDKMPVITWLISSPSWFMNEFLVFIPWLIIDKRPQPADLQFLVNIYQKEYVYAFKLIVNVLDLETCDYLLSRSANPELRNLIKNRKSLLLENKKNLYYGFINYSANLPSYPTIFGDKIDLIIRALELLKNGMNNNFRSPYGAKRFHTLLQACDLIFQCGLIEDSLVILLDLYEDYQQKNRLADMMEDEKIFKQLNKLLRKVVPMYALLSNPLDPYTDTLNIYNKYFPRFNPDPASVQYLNIYTSITAGLNTETNNILYEILYKTGEIIKYRPQEIPLLNENEIRNNLTPYRLAELQKLIEQKIIALPHEAFVVMEYIRLLIARELIMPEEQLISELLSQYLNFWKWIPGKLFINQPIIEQLGPMINDENRYEAEHILTAMQDFSNDNKLLKDLLNRPELFKKKDNKTRLDVLIGKLMGVL